MIKLHNRLFISGQGECFLAEGDQSLVKDGTAIVHACKSPCHQLAVGYEGNLSKDHMYYLSREYGDDLALNIIDPPVPLFQLQTFQIFRRFATQRYAEGKELHIHCNKAESRAPALAMIMLSRVLQIMSDESYESYDAAKREFMEIYPRLTPGQGIELFMRANWSVL